MEDVKVWYKEWWGVLIIVIITIILIFLVAFGFYVYSLVGQIKSGQLPGNTVNFQGQKKYNAENEGSYWIGSSNPKVTIVEFSDFSCPYCEKSFPTIREISKKYKDVKIIYRDFPLRQEYSADLSLAARCAGEQGLFWVMHDKLFLNQNVSTKSQLDELAKQIGADVAKFDNCFNSKKYIPQIQKDITDAESFGIQGTPAFFVNGYKLEGDIPMKTWEEIINKFK